MAPRCPATYSTKYLPQNTDNIRVSLPSVPPCLRPCQYPTAQPTVGAHSPLRCPFLPRCLCLCRSPPWNAFPDSSSCPNLGHPARASTLPLLRSLLQTSVRAGPRRGNSENNTGLISKGLTVRGGGKKRKHINRDTKVELEGTDRKMIFAAKKKKVALVSHV